MLILGLLKILYACFLVHGICAANHVTVLPWSLSFWRISFPICISIISDCIKKSVNFVKRCTRHLRISGLPNQSKYTNNSSRMTRERFELCPWLVLESVQFSNVKICFKRYVLICYIFIFLSFPVPIFLNVNEAKLMKKWQLSYDKIKLTSFLNFSDYGYT